MYIATYRYVPGNAVCPYTYYHDQHHTTPHHTTPHHTTPHHTTMDHNAPHRAHLPATRANTAASISTPELPRLTDRYAPLPICNTHAYLVPQVLQRSQRGGRCDAPRVRSLATRSLLVQSGRWDYVPRYGLASVGLVLVVRSIEAACRATHAPRSQQRGGPMSGNPIHKAYTPVVPQNTHAYIIIENF